MNRLALKAVLGSILVFAAVAAVCLSGGCGGSAPEASAKSPVPSPAPSWVTEAAAMQAAHWGDAHPEAAYWGLLHDPQLGEITASGPNDPSHKAYVIILVGDYEQMYSQVHWPRPPSTPLPAIKWIYFLYTTTTHADAGSFGFGIKEFDATRYPDLQPLAL